MKRRSHVRFFCDENVCDGEVSASVREVPAESSSPREIKLPKYPKKATAAAVRHDLRCAESGGSVTTSAFPVRQVVTLNYRGGRLSHGFHCALTKKTTTTFSRYRRQPSTLPPPSSPSPAPTSRREPPRDEMTSTMRPPLLSVRLRHEPVDGEVPRRLGQRQRHAVELLRGDDLAPQPRRLRQPEREVEHVVLVVVGLG